MTTDVVLCFDRDHTVDVNPHPERAAVPLAWVQTWAHDAPGVDVWATGNELLAPEARVPDRTVAGHAWNAVHGGDVRDRHYHVDGPLAEVHPPREGGLVMVEETYDAVDADPRFVVVDDVDLSSFAADRRAWTYYEPWAFVPAVRGGEADVPAPPAPEEWGTDQREADEPAAFHVPAPVEAAGVDVGDVVLPE